MGLAEVLDGVGALSLSDRLLVLRSLLGTVGRGETMQVEVHSRGYVVYAEDAGHQECVSWMLSPGTNLLDAPLLGILYLAGLAYIFLGVAIISDIFMASIEVITAAEGTKRYRDASGQMVEYTYKLVNPTVANLTLMALGSSAPEILLSIIGAIQTLDAEPDKLGPSTIVGSAAFNLLVITAICISALPDGEVKRIKDLSVFATTAVFSVVAYIWLYVALQVSSPDVVELWEGLVTLGLFGVLLLVAYVIDVRGKCCRPPAEVTPVDDGERAAARESQLSRTASARELMSELHRSRESLRAGHMPTAEMNDTQVTGYVPLRSQALRSLTGQRRLHSHAEPADEGGAMTPRSVGSNDGRRRSTGDRRGSASGAAGPALGLFSSGSSLVNAPAAAADSPAKPGVADDDAVTMLSGGAPGDGPGQVHFEEGAVLCEEAIGKVRLVLLRSHGADGSLTVSYATRDDSAVAGVDYLAAKGSVTFLPGEVRKIVEVEIVDDDKPEADNTFHVDLFAEGSAALAPRGRSCAVTILDDDSWEGRTRRVQTQLRNAMATSFYASKFWSDRFKNAIELSGGVDEETGEEIPPTWFDALMHAVSLFWKLQFALVPPETWLMGWPAFFISLGFVGIWTAVVGEMASLFGCTVGLGDLVTAITVVALGTSLPDTFASRLAVLHDEYADAAIGNITGSNSVNVFLGLGIPWVFGSLYHRYAPTGKGRYDVPSGSLGFSVALFCVCAFAALGALVARRVTTGGELGGSRRSASLLSAFFVVLWVLYILLASLADRGVYEAF